MRTSSLQHSLHVIAVLIAIFGALALLPAQQTPTYGRALAAGCILPTINVVRSGAQVKEML